ncbi:TadE/TadG family type IV pilus assembly protein [Pontimonas salivibrio]|uniref:TadE/TadG family type IV pilus assembly protein n=1 Tax=Pontimonas salivibrio TaxID=1159327 RepID=UPI000CF2FF42|nr:TadE/TadG family type IV pilus assembly protein [Pontimonas salivibrio]
MRCGRFSPTWCAVHLVSPRDRGSVTAEWALVLPAVVLVLAAVLSSVGVMVQQSRLDGVAADAARLASLGHSAALIAGHVGDQLGEEATVSLQSASEGISVCAVVEAMSSGPLSIVTGLTMQGMACALRESEPVAEATTPRESL